MLAQTSTCDGMVAEWANNLMEEARSSPVHRLVDYIYVTNHAPEYFNSAILECNPLTKFACAMTAVVRLSVVPFSARPGGK